MLDSYAYAKIFSLMPRTYIRDNLKKLLVVKGLAEMFDLLFPGEHYELQERRLIPQLQRKINFRNIHTVVKVLNVMERPHPLLIHALRRYEYQNVKTIFRFLTQDADDNQFSLWDLGPYAALSLKKQDLMNKEAIAKLIMQSPYKWILETENRQQPYFELCNRLDLDYYKQLWKLVSDLSKVDHQSVVKLVSAEILFQNVVWALRLRFYFKFDKEKASRLLIDVSAAHLLDPALEVFDLAPDEPGGWQSWKLSWLVSDQLNKEMRGIDPVAVNEKVTRYLSTRAWKYFHADPFTLGPFYCFIKLKELEANLLQSVVEGLAMNLSHSEILGANGII